MGACTCREGSLKLQLARRVWALNGTYRTATARHSTPLHSTPLHSTPLHSTPYPHSHSTPAFTHPPAILGCPCTSWASVIALHCSVGLSQSRKLSFLFTDVMSHLAQERHWGATPRGRCKHTFCRRHGIPRGHRKEECLAGLLKVGSSPRTGALGAFGPCPRPPHHRCCRSRRRAESRRPALLSQWLSLGCSVAPASAVDRLRAPGRATALQRRDSWQSRLRSSVAGSTSPLRSSLAVLSATSRAFIAGPRT